MVFVIIATKVIPLYRVVCCHLYVLDPAQIFCKLKSSAVSHFFSIPIFNVSNAFRRNQYKVTSFFTSNFSSLDECLTKNLRS